jgi:anti-anti-sigma factor
MTVDHTPPPILLIRGEGHLGGQVELYLLDADGTMNLLVRRDSPRDGSDLEAVVAEVAAGGTRFRDVLVDLERVQWLNSTGLGWLVGLVRQRKDQGDSAALACVNERVAKLLHATSLDLVVPSHETVAAAIRALRPAPEDDAD